MTRKLSANSVIYDKLNISVISKSIPKWKINEILDYHGRASVRTRKLPSHILVYYVILLSLFMETNTKEVLRILLEGVRDVFGEELVLAGKSGISQSRSRVGAGVFKDLYHSVVKPISIVCSKGSYYKEKLLVGIDGFVCELPDEDAVRCEYDKPSSGGYPQMRVVSLCELGTHILFGAQIGNITGGENSLAKSCYDYLKPNMLCIADRGFYSYESYNSVISKGSDILWRVSKIIDLKPQKILSDGSYISHLIIPRDVKKKQANLPSQIKVRVIEFEVKGVSNSDNKYSLITNLMDVEKYPALELANLYHERWEIETAFKELKTYMRGGDDVRLRSKTPELLRQELYGFLMGHFAIRSIMYEAAMSSSKDPDEVSFTHSLNVIKRKVIVIKTFSP